MDDHRNSSNVYDDNSNNTDSAKDKDEDMGKDSKISNHNNNDTDVMGENYIDKKYSISISIY